MIMTVLMLHYWGSAKKIQEQVNEVVNLPIYFLSNKRMFLLSERHKNSIQHDEEEEEVGHDDEVEIWKCSFHHSIHCELLFCITKNKEIDKFGITLYEIGKGVRESGLFEGSWEKLLVVLY